MDTLPSNLDGIPALPPPPGQVANLKSGLAPSQAAIIAVAGVFLHLMLMAVITRVYVRTRIIKLWGIEDTTCILAAVDVALGIGKHSWNVPITVVMSANNLRILSPNITYLFAGCFAKLSILFLYLRLFPVHRERVFIWIGIVMNIVLSTTFMAMSIANLIECIKFTSDITAFCRFIHEEMVLWVAAANVFTDFYIAILPIPRVLNLQTSNRRKVGLVLTFASGFCACGSSVARLVHTCQNLYNPDAFWSSAHLAILSIVEINIGIIVACVCTFPVFVRMLHESQFSKVFSRQCMRSLLGSSRRRRSTSNSSDAGSLPLPAADKHPAAAVVIVNSIISSRENDEDREMRKFDPRGSVIGVEVG